MIAYAESSSCCCLGAVRGIVSCYIHTDLVLIWRSHSLGNVFASLPQVTERWDSLLEPRLII